MFPDRTTAGYFLGRIVAARLHEAEIVVLALPRGGVTVGLAVAQYLSASAFDILPVRKLGVPGQEELAFGAIASGGIRILNHDVINQYALSQETIERVEEQEQNELNRREVAFHEGRAPLDLRGRTVVLTDDGLATGATMLAAVQAVRLQKPGKLVVAVPVASRTASGEVRKVVDEVICARIPESFNAVGCWYRNFEQVTDEEVRDLLRRFRTP